MALKPIAQRTTRALLCSATLCSAIPALAQQDPGAAAERNIRQNLPSAEPRTPYTTTPEPPPASPTEADIPRLAGVNVIAPTHLPELIADIRTRWQPLIGQPVSGEQVNLFKDWLWQQLRTRGHLAYLNTKLEHSHNEGQWLIVTLTAPTLGKVLVMAPPGETAQAGQTHADEVARRFNRAIHSGTPIDIQGIEAQLDAIAYDLPIQLDATLRQNNAQTVDIIINVRPLQTPGGTINSLLLQTNNHGLKTYGRAQLLSVVRLAGFTPQSEAIGLAQTSRGVHHLRGEYRAPLIGTASRWHIWASHTDSHANQVRSASHDIGAGLTRLLHTDRSLSAHASAELTHRHSTSHIAGQNQRDRRDQQLRLSLRTRHHNSPTSQAQTELNLHTGHLRLTPRDLAHATDASQYRLQGSYQKLEWNGALQHTLDDAKRWTASLRWRSQIAGNNLDNHHQFNLGGINGIRAYSTEDGVGDEGAQISLDLIHHLTPHWWAGILHDAGSVRPHKRKLPTDNTAPYHLRGTGLQTGGSQGPWHWTLSLAKSFGPQPTTPNALSGKVGDWRANFALTYQR